jgi:hypothetical protein
LIEAPKSSATLRRLALMAAHGAVLLFIAQLVYDPTPISDVVVVIRLRAGVALAIMGMAFAYAALVFERFDNAEWFEFLSAIAFAAVAWGGIENALR